MVIVDIEMPKGCVYEDADGKTKYCAFCNHKDVPFCTYIDYESEAAIGIDEYPVYCPIVSEYFPHQSVPCDLCKKYGLEDGDTLYMSSDWDGGIGFDYIRDIHFCPVCGRRLKHE